MEQFYREEPSLDTKLHVSRKLKASSDHNTSDSDSDLDDVTFDGDGNIISGTLHYLCFCYKIAFILVKFTLTDAMTVRKE